MSDTGAGTPPGQQTDLAHAASAKAVRSALTFWLALNWFATRVVNEFIVAFLDTLPLDRRPESKPFTPWVLLSDYNHSRVTRSATRFIPAALDRGVGAPLRARRPARSRTASGTRAARSCRPASPWRPRCRT